MKKGVITVYFSWVFLMLMSLFFVLLESCRVRILTMEGERYADMAAEMTFAGYVQPLADQYDLLALYQGSQGSQLDKFETYLKYNLEQAQKGNRLFHLYGDVIEAEHNEEASFRDDDWQALKDQVQQYEVAKAVEKGKNTIQQLLGEVVGTNAEEAVKDYCGQLQTQGERMETAQRENEKDSEKSEPDAPVAKIEDPRQGITRWMKSGLLALVMGEQPVSDQTVSVSNCSWQTSEERKTNVMTVFDQYRDIVATMRNQNLLSQMREQLQTQSDQMMINLYIFDHFKSLRNDDASVQDTALQYEIEYLAFGHHTDQENLESAVTACFMLRTIMNLAYLYLSPDKDADLRMAVDGILSIGMIPVAGEVLKLLIMICWASAEAVVDCAGLAEGGKVPMIKNRSSWNLSMAQLQQVASNGGKASNYFKSTEKGLDYDQYLFLFLTLTAPEKKIIRMTQLIENNLWRMKGYENFQLKNCCVKSVFSARIHIDSFFWQRLKNYQYTVKTVYSY